jgi:hypothetical protein
MDKRIAQIVEINPPSLDGKGRYKFRRYGRIDQDDELDHDDDEFVAEERRDSATDNEDSPVQTKRADAQRQEEEEEEEEEGAEGQAEIHRPGARSNQHAEHQEEEGTEEQAAEQPVTGRRTRMATRRSGVSLGEAPGPKRRRTVSSMFSSLSSLSLR